MGRPIALAIILAAIAILVAFRGEATIGGLTPDQFGSLAWLAAFSIIAIGWAAHLARGRWGNAFQSLAFWLIAMAAIAALYTYRLEIASLSNRVLTEVSPGATETAAGGEVTVTRRPGSDFIVSGSVNGRDTRFLFDTGASTLVLTAETARAIGIDLDKLSFIYAVTTANGRALAAGVVLDRVTIGSISEQRVNALVAQPGALWQNLLGMSFLNRLASYEVRGDRLTMRGRDAGARATR